MKIKKLKKELSDRDITIRNQKIGMVSAAVLFVAILLRPSKAYELIKTITNDN
jgi:hypothetical protein